MRAHKSSAAGGNGSRTSAAEGGNGLGGPTSAGASAMGGAGSGAGAAGGAGAGTSGEGAERSGAGVAQAATSATSANRGTRRLRNSVSRQIAQNSGDSRRRRQKREPTHPSEGARTGGTRLEPDGSSPYAQQSGTRCRGTLPEAVLPLAQRRKRIDRFCERAAGVCLRGREHGGLGGAEERIRRAFVGHLGGDRRLAPITLRLLAQLPFAQRDVVGLDRKCKAHVGERVFVPAVDTGVPRQCRQLCERGHHLRGRSFE